MQARHDLQKIVPLFAQSYYKHEEVIHISLANLFFIISCLKHHINYQYKLLTCIAGVDNLHSKYRFNVVYDLLSLVFNNRLRVKVYLNEVTSVHSLTNIFKNANWWEREVWDLFGLYFTKHPDLRRILTDYGFEGFPMRKDFPLSGFIEVRYDLSKKQIISEKIEFAQNFRFFSFETPW